MHKSVFINSWRMFDFGVEASDRAVRVHANCKSASKLDCPFRMYLNAKYLATLSSTGVSNQVVLPIDRLIDNWPIANTCALKTVYKVYNVGMTVVSQVSIFTNTIYVILNQ